MRVWFAHARRDYGTAAAAAALQMIRARWPGCEVIDPERLVWEPGIAERLLPTCQAVACLAREPAALGVRAELRLAEGLGLPVLGLMPQKVAGRLPVSFRAVPVGGKTPPIHQDKYGYVFGIWWDETTPRVPPPGWMYGDFWHFSPVGDGATYSLRILAPNGAVLLEHSEHVEYLGVASEGAITALAVSGGSYELTVAFDNPEFPGNSEDGEIGDGHVVHEWWPGA